jgi:hypothetical protein
MTAKRFVADPVRLQRRLDVAAAITRLNALQLRHRQMLGGAEIDIARLEMIADGGEVTEVQRVALCEACMRQQEICTAMARCDDELAALNAQLEVIDREISVG